MILKEEIKYTELNATYSHNIHGYYIGIRIISSPSNCKLCYMERVHSFLNKLTEEQSIEVFNAALDKSSRLVFVSVIHEKTMEFLVENFDIEYCIKLPYGYNGKFQYHILIRNTKKMDKEYLNRKDKSISIVPKPAVIKAPDTISNELIVKTIERREYKTVRGMFNGFKKLLKVK
jgi:hypothetical protein